MDVRLIATDMDGTLLGSDHRISPRNSAAFAAAIAAAGGGDRVRRHP